MSYNQTIYREVNPVFAEKLMMSREEAENLEMRDIHCPYCGYLVEKVFSDVCGHKQVFCKKCKHEYIINLGYFRRQKKLKYFKLKFPDKGRQIR